MPIDNYINFFLYADFDTSVHCYSIRDKRLSSIDLKKSMAEKEEKKYMEIARKYNKKDPNKPLNASELKVLGTRNLDGTDDCISVEEERAHAP